MAKNMAKKPQGSRNKVWQVMFCIKESQLILDYKMSFVSRKYQALSFIKLASCKGNNSPWFSILKVCQLNPELSQKAHSSLLIKALQALHDAPPLR